MDAPRAHVALTTNGDRSMQLDGIHHITCTTGDARRNLDFYTRVLGLRLVKKTVNQDDPSIYHLFYADEHGSPGADITFFEWPGAKAGRAGAGMAHTIVWRVGSGEAVDFWVTRLKAEGVARSLSDERLRFTDPDGLQHEVAPADTRDAPLVAQHPEIPARVALQGFAGVRAFAADPDVSTTFLSETLGFEPGSEEDSWQVKGPSRSAFYAYDPPPAAAGRPGAGTVHHVAFSTEVEEQDAWYVRVAASDADPSPVIDRFWFRSLYVREPSGILFELATKGPGLTADEPLDSLGGRLTLPPSFEDRREQIERTLTPLPNPRS